jgi:hypothetical protein
MINSEFEEDLCLEHYHEQHKFCPKCGGSRNKMDITMIGFMINWKYPENYKDKNIATCKCGWTGTVHELISK